MVAQLEKAWVFVGRGERTSVGVGEYLLGLGHPLASLDEPTNSNQIEESHDRTIDHPVFRSTMLPISIDNVEVADGKSLTLDQGRQEPMHRVEIWEAQKHVPAKSLEPTSGVACIIVQ